RAYPSLNLKINLNAALTEADVVLPGLRFDDIDFTGQPDVWRVFDMVNRVEHAAFFSHPSFLDYVHLYKQNYATIVKACRIDIKSDFYETVTPKAPLDVSIRLCHVGTSSFMTLGGIACGGSMSPHVTLQNTHTLIHRKENNRVEPLPEWWTNRFKVQPENLIKPTNVIQGTKPQETFQHVFGVPLGDTDSTQMTRCASYLRYFVENASVASKLGFYKLGTNFHDFHIKQMSLLYIAPSYWGDSLMSETWEDKDDELSLHCMVSSHDHRPVWYAKMTLFSEVFGLK
ncbi:hypothetical protein FSP39_021227, partial [Pinctada imbricata]